MNSDRDGAVNNAAMDLLMDACPIELGMPAKLIHELVFGKYPVFTVNDVFGMSELTSGHSMIEEYMNKKGYVFSWGTLSEYSTSDSDDSESLPILRFEFLPLDLLLMFPQSAQLEDLFMHLYRNHPHYYPEFDCDEGFGNWSVISFYSEEGRGDELRHWIADVFIPLIWRDVLDEATRIVEERKAAAIAQSSDGSFRELLVERGRCQLCVDPAELQFVALRHLEEIW